MLILLVNYFLEDGKAFSMTILNFVVRSEHFFYSSNSNV